VQSPGGDNDKQLQPRGGGYAATAPPFTVRAAQGYGAIPPASRVATAIAARRPTGPPWDPGASMAPASTQCGQARPAPPGAALSVSTL